MKGYYSLTLMTSPSTVTPSGGQFLGGVFTAPVNGFYLICISARLQQKQIEFTMRNNGARFCATGSSVPDVPNVDGE